MSVPPSLQQAARQALTDIDLIAERFIAWARERRMPALMRLDVPEETLVAIGRTRMSELLEHLADDDFAAYLQILIARYEAGQTSGQQLLGKQALVLGDFVQALAAQKLAVLDWLRCQPHGGAEVAEMAMALEGLFADIEAAYALSWERMREEYLRLTAENARIRELNTELAQRNEELKLTAEVSRALTLSGSPDTVLKRGLHSLCALLGTEYGAIWLWDDAADGLQIRAHYRLEAIDIAAINRGYRHRHDGAPPLDAFNTQESAAFSDALADPAFANYRHFAEQLGFRAAIYLPLVYLGRSLGVLSLYYAEPHAFSPHELRLLRSFSDQMAIAIQVAALVDELTCARATLEAQVQERTREVKREKDFIKSIVDNAPAAIAYLDLDERYRWVNPAFVRLTGVAEPALLGRRVSEVFPSLPPDTLDFAQLSAPLHRTEVPYLLPGPGGPRPSYWDTTLVPVRDGDDRPSGVLVLALEVSERVEREQLRDAQMAALKEADRLKDQFLSILSHELRTPINAILGFGSILEDEVAGPLNETQHRYLQRLLSGADMLLSLVNDLLDMSRIQAGKFALHPGAVALGDVVEECVATLRPLAEQKRQRLTLTLDPAIPTLCADQQRLHQVLGNLLANAIKFTPEGGSIAVGARRDGACVRVEVSDDGPGIAPEDRPRLFQPFTQLDMSNTRTARGTGLGLSIAKALIEAHGGEIGVESAPGSGSTFWFTVPLRS